MRRFGPLVPAVLSLWVAFWLVSAAGARPSAKRQPLKIATAAGARSFSVELAATGRPWTAG